ncbi:hypothetical protein LCGC14_2131310, partial [marine sediment metagenome]
PGRAEQRTKEQYMELQEKGYLWILSTHSQKILNMHA